MPDGSKGHLLVGAHAILWGIATDHHVEADVVEKLRQAMQLLHDAIADVPLQHLDGTPGTYAEVL